MMTKEELLEYYSSLLIFQYRNQPKAKATAKLLASLSVCDMLPTLLGGCFNLDTATGAQLDVIAKIVGINRRVYGLDLEHTYFSFDNYAGDGGVGMGDYTVDPYPSALFRQYNIDAIYTCSDFELLALIKLKIIQNCARMTTKGITDALYAAFEKDITMTDTTPVYAYTPDIELDYMEYSSDALAREAYKSNSEVVDQQYIGVENNATLTVGKDSNGGTASAQSFILSGTKTVTSVEVMRGARVGIPTGNWTLRIETNVGGLPSGILADVNAEVVVSPPSSDGTTVKGTFATPFNLSAGTTYWLVIVGDAQSSDNYWALSSYDSGSSYANGTAAIRAVDSNWYVQGIDMWFKIYVQGSVYLQSYSESTIKTQGSYALKAVAAITTSLNKALTHTFASPLNLSGINTAEFDIRASRTGANIKVELHNANGTTTEITPTISSAGTYQTVIWDLSAVVDADKNAIDSIIVTVVNADAANTFYIDNFNGGAYTPTVVAGLYYTAIPLYTTVITVAKFLNILPKPMGIATFVNYS